MLLSKKGKVCIKGNARELAVELVHIMRGLLEEGALSKSDIAHCLAVALMSDEEIHEIIQNFESENGLDDDTTFTDLFGDIL